MVAGNRMLEGGAIASFAALRSGVANQSIPVGDRAFRAEPAGRAGGTVYRISENILVTEDSTSGNNRERDSGKNVTTITISKEQIPVTWDSAPAYDGDVEGSYVFTTDVVGYLLYDDMWSRHRSPWR